MTIHPLTVGVVGVIDDAFYSSTVPENIKGLTFTEESAKASEIAAVLREQEHCDIVVAITHQEDCEGFVAELSGVDAVIAGHEHLLINDAYPDQNGKLVPVMEAGYYFLNVGMLSLTYDADTKTVSAAQTVYSCAQTAGMSNKKTAARIAEIEARQSTVLGEVIGTSSAAYPYSWEEIRVSEQAIGRIVAASYLDWTGADVSMENAGGIRAGVPAGDITYADLIGISPYGNILVLIELTGQQILDIV